MRILKTISKIYDGSIIKFKDREKASELLCTILEGKFKLANKDVLILGIPRGGIIVGDIIAQKFGYQFAIVIPRRMVAPYNRELAIGGLMKDNSLYLNTLLIKTLKITENYLNLEIKKQLEEINKREELLGKQIEGDQIRNKNIILVDDGVATGSTLIVASRWIRKYKPKHLTILVPVCPKPVFKILKREVDYIESIITPSLKNFTTVEMFYQNFEQLKIEELINILKKYRK